MVSPTDGASMFMFWMFELGTVMLMLRGVARAWQGCRLKTKNAATKIIDLDDDDDLIQVKIKNAATKIIILDDDDDFTEAQISKEIMMQTKKNNIIHQNMKPSEMILPCRSW